MAVKVQVTLSNTESIDVYNSLKHGTRSMAVEQALLLLYQDEKMKKMFFNDVATKKTSKKEAIIVTNKTEPSTSEQIKPSEDSDNIILPPENTTDKGQIKESTPKLAEKKVEVKW